MLPRVEDIGKRRSALGLTQKELSRASGVSQSMIAKIENGTAEPSYEIAGRIFQALDSLEKEERKKATAGDLCTKNVAGVAPGDRMARVIERMAQRSISQLPVLDGETPVGSVSDETVRRQTALYAAQGKDLNRMAAAPVEEVMDEPFPQVSESEPVESVVALLERNQAVLTVKKGKVTGIITKANLLKVVGVKSR